MGELFKYVPSTQNSCVVPHCSPPIARPCEAVGIQQSGYGMGIATQARGQAVRSCTLVVLQHSLAAWASLHASIIGNGRR